MNACNFVCIIYFPRLENSDSLFKDKCLPHIDLNFSNTSRLCRKKLTFRRILPLLELKLRVNLGFDNINSGKAQYKNFNNYFGIYSTLYEILFIFWKIANNNGNNAEYHVLFLSVNSKIKLKRSFIRYLYWNTNRDHWPLVPFPTL